jgi:ribosomal protein S18 acetylase RimI-like enzyme
MAAAPGTDFHLLARSISSSRFLLLGRVVLLAHVLLLCSTSSSSSSSSWGSNTTMFVSAFLIGPSSADIVRRQQPRQTALKVVTSRSSINGSSSSSATAGGTTERRNGKHLPLESQEEEDDDEKMQQRIPFIIEQLPMMKKSDFNTNNNNNNNPLYDRVFQEISEMCIDVFFNDNCISESKPTPIWKEVQLAYLRKLQQGDLRQRRKNNADTNLMFLARQVVPVKVNNNNNNHHHHHHHHHFSNNNNNNKYDFEDHTNKPLVLDLSQVYNLPRRRRKSTTTTTTTRNPFELLNYINGNNDHNVDDVDYVCGRVLGFVEVTQRSYGLGEEDDDETITTTTAASSSIHTSNDRMAQPQRWNTLRPILTNLAVRYEARGSGVGSRLLQALEQGVLTQWKGNNNLNNKEIILEVEDDNEKAIQFYQKRGYRPIFQDPASRRYDTNGLILRQMRCNRIVMRKNLVDKSSSPLSSLLVPASSSTLHPGGDELAFLTKAFQRLKESVLSF